MNAKETRPSILLIDDNETVVTGLRDWLATRLRGAEADVQIWVPKQEDGDPEEALAHRVDSHTALVITDYDLTTSVKGLFGLSIVGWCQNKSIPVGDFSRGKVSSLPKEPNLFELRVPSNDEDGSAFVASTFRGFQTIRSVLESKPSVLKEKRSLASVLASLLGREHLDSHFAMYMSRLGAANSALLQRLRDFAGSETPDDDDKTRLLTYVLGHVLLNAILKYPGPILGVQALCAYVATSTDEIDEIAPLFESARYDGPFSDGGRYYWKEDVDRAVDEFAAPLTADEFDSFGDYNRRAVEAALGRALRPHDCDRCDGLNGGFWCPFTHRPVCQRADCSVPASSWIPQGAQLSRVERDFYEEWAPLLGL